MSLLSRLMQPDVQRSLGSNLPFPPDCPLVFDKKKHQLQLHGARVWFDKPEDDGSRRDFLHIAGLQIPPSSCSVHALKWVDNTTLEIIIDAGVDGLEVGLQCHVTLVEALTGEGVTAPRLECTARVISCTKNGVTIRCRVSPGVVDVTVANRNWMTQANHHLRTTMRSALLPRLKLASGAIAEISLKQDDVVRFNSALSDLQILCGVEPDACVQISNGEQGVDAQTMQPTTFAPWLDGRE